MASIAGAAVAAPMLAKSAPLKNLCLEVPLPEVQLARLRMPPPLALLRQLFLAPGSFTTPRHHHTARYLEVEGYLERTHEDAKGIYWRLTDAGAERAARHIAEFPTGDAFVRVPTQLQAA